MKRFSGVKAGFSLYEMGLVLAGIAGAMLVLAYYGNKGAEEMRMTSVASHFKTVMEAAEKYVRRNDDKIRKALDGLEPTTRVSGPQITLKMLLDDGALPERAAVATGSGNETTYTARNAWGQDYYITTRLVKGQNSGNETSAQKDDLAVVVMTTGGRGAEKRDRDFANVVVPETAVLAGAGFVPDPASGIYEKGVVRGPYGSWALKLSDVGLEDYDSPGHLAMLSSFDASDLKQDYLYREVIPGHPELNAMQTDLNMNDFDIENAQTIRFNDYGSVAHDENGIFNDAVRDDVGNIIKKGWKCDNQHPENNGKTFLDHQNGLFLCRNVGGHYVNGVLVGGEYKWTTVSDTGNSHLLQFTTIASNGQEFDKPSCPVGSDTEPFVYAMPVNAAPTGKDHPVDALMPMHAMRTWVEENGDIWKVQFEVLDSYNNWVKPEKEGYFGKVMVFATCE